MATIKQRIEAMEQKIAPTMPPLVFFAADDNSFTPEQQTQIDEAEAIGRKVIVVCWVG